MTARHHDMHQDNWMKLTFSSVSIHIGHIDSLEISSHSKAEECHLDGG